MAITIRSGKELGSSKEVKNEKVKTKNEEARLEKNEEKKEDRKFILKKNVNFQKFLPIHSTFTISTKIKKCQLRWEIYNISK